MLYEKVVWELKYDLYESEVIFLCKGGLRLW